MRKIRFVGLKFIVIGAVVAAILGLVMRGFWNVLMPALFGLPAIGFWQALGLLVLGRLLFGGFPGRGYRMRGARFARGWASLTAEERQRFREAMGGQCPPRFGEPGKA